MKSSPILEDLCGASPTAIDQLTSASLRYSKGGHPFRPLAQSVTHKSPSSKMKNKLETFPVPTSSENSGVKCLIVGVLPLWSVKEWNSSYERILKEQLKSLTTVSLGNISISGVWICSFDAKDVLSGMTTIDNVASVFARKLDEQRSLIEYKCGDTSDTTSNVERNRIQPEPIVFIAHSIGLWVVKSLLAQNEYPSIIFDTRGAIFLDAPNETVTGDDALVDYLHSLRRYSVGKPQPAWIDRSKLMITCGINDESPRKVNERLRKVQDSIRQVEERFKVTQQDPYIKGNKSHIADSPNVTILPVPLQTSQGSVRNSSLEHEARLGNSVLKIFKKASRKQSAVFSLPEKLEKLFQQYTDQHGGKASKYLGLPSAPALAAIPEHKQSRHPVRQSLSPARQPIGMDLMLRYPGLEMYHERGTEASTDVDSTTSGSSQLSHPLMETGITESLSQETVSAIALARSFYQRAEFSNAETTFKTSRALCEPIEDLVRRYQVICIDAQLAAITLFRGNYLDAENQFVGLLATLKNVLPTSLQKDDLELDLQRWLATALLYQKQYDKAKEKLDALNSELPSRGHDVARVRILRDLSLANAHLGRYDLAERQIKSAEGRILERLRVIQSKFDPVPRGVDDDKRSSRLRALRELNAAQNMIHMAKSIVESSWGFYENSLVFNKKALRGLEERFGQRHFRTLECGSRASVLLAHNSIIPEGEKECLRVLDLMRKNLGPEHPETLKAYENLVFIMRLQKRLAEALDTAKSLKWRSKAALGERHPQTLGSSLALSKVYLEVGNYLDAYLEMRNLVVLSQKTYGARHINTLQYRATYARTLFEFGLFDEAKSEALSSFQEQQKLFCVPGPTQPPSTASLDGNAEESVGAETLFRTFIDHIEKNSHDFKIHPSILFNMETFALLEKEKREPDHDLVVKVFKFVWTQRTKAMKKTHALTISVRNAYAIALRDRSGNEAELIHAETHFREIVRLRMQTLGQAHPDVHSAQREFLIINCMLDRLSEYPVTIDSHTEREGSSDSSGNHEPSEPISHTRGLDNAAWVDVEDKSWRIFSMHELHFGGEHIETINSHIWLLTVQLILQREELWRKTLQKLLSRLCSYDSCSQRIIRSILLRREVASLLARDGNESERVEVLRGILEDIKSSQHEILSAALDHLRETIEEKDTKEAGNLGSISIKLKGSSTSASPVLR